jgi:hypothetical protein
MTDKEIVFTGIVVAAIIIGILFAKISFIWRDVMLEQSERIAKDLDRKKKIEDYKRKHLSELAIKGAKIKNLGKMCESCAFKKDSPANLEPHNVDGAFQTLAYYGTFNCHKNEYEDAGKVCVGFTYAKQHIKNKEENE